MDAIFDIDGTLADATHRLHFITDPQYWNEPFKPDWDSFLSDEHMIKDTPIAPMFEVLYSLLSAKNRVIFITGRPLEKRRLTADWLTDVTCPVRAMAADAMTIIFSGGPVIYMRSSGDRRPSHVVKEQLLLRARRDGFKPTLAFDDRKSDADMWRRNGLLCFQVSEGNF